MTIRRRITTTIDEIDDSIDSGSHTIVPTRPNNDFLLSNDTGTSIDANEPIDNDESKREISYNSTAKPTVGRTFPDLVIEFKNDNRAILVILVIIPYIVFISKIDVEKLQSLLLPTIVAFLLILLWFGGKIVKRIFKRSKK
jgi:hypothetical protein